MIKKILWFLIFIVAIFTRTFRLEFSPPRLTHDEMSIGYNAYSILKTGKDEWERSLPLDFEAFGDHKLPGYIYTLAPFLVLLPLNVFSLKIPSILAGLALIFATYKIIQLLTKKDLTALLAALLMAVSPWAIHLSRMALESNLALASFSWGVFFLLLGFTQQKKVTAHFILAGIFLGLTSYFYVAYRLICFTLIVLVGVSYFHLGHYRKSLIILAFTWIVVNLPLATLLLGKAGTARFTQVSIFSDEGIAATIQEQQNFCFLSEPRVLPRLCRAVYNKPFLYAETFAKNYLSFLFPTFLFIQGDELHYLNDPSFGEFFLLLAPFYLLGLFAFLRKKDFSIRIVQIATLLAPIPSALVSDPQIVRGSALLIFIIIWTTLGISTFSQYLSKRQHQLIFIGLFGCVLGISFLRYGISYAYIYPGKYETAFYPLPPSVITFLQTNAECPYDVNDTNTHNYYVVKYTCELPSGFERVKRINFLDGNPEFFIDRPVGTPVDRDPSLTTVAL